MGMYTARLATSSFDVKDREADQRPLILLTKVIADFLRRGGMDVHQPWPAQLQPSTSTAGEAASDALWAKGLSCHAMQLGDSSSS